MKRLVGKRGIGRLLVALALAGAALAACGGGSKADESSSDEKSAAADGSPTTTAADGAEGAKSGKAGKAAGSSKASDPKATTSTTAGPAKSAEAEKDPDYAPWSKEMEITVALTERCVRPGGSQTVTIGAPPASGVGYNTYYSDGKSGLSDGFYGGNKGGFTDESGTWTDTFVVAPNAPAGHTVVAVLATGAFGGRGEGGAEFWVADALGLCDGP